MEKKIRFEKLSVEKGLSTSAVNKIIQDKKGFLWIGTQDGLNRYDGYHFRVYRNNQSKGDSLPENHVFNMYEMNNGKLLIGTSKSGIAVYDYWRDSFTQLDINFDLTSSFVSSFAEDNDGNLWIGTFGNGLFRYNYNSNMTKHYYSEQNSINNNRIKCLCSDIENECLYIGSWGGGINIYDYRSDTFSYFKCSENDSNTLSDNIITCLFKDSERNIWAGTRNGLNKIDGSKGITRYKREGNSGLTSNYIYAVTEDHNKHLWIGTRYDGLNCMEIKSGKIVSYKYDETNLESLPSNSIQTLYADKTNVLWIGTFGEGVVKANLPEKKFQTGKNVSDDLQNKKSNWIRALTSDNKNNIWAGTFEDGLYQFERKNGAYTNGKKYLEIKKNTIDALYFSKNNLLWISSRENGFCSIDIKSGSYRKYRIPNQINQNDYIAALDGDNDIIWLGYDSSGIKKFNAETGLLSNENLPESLNMLYVKSLLYDNDILWIGTKNEGLIKYDILRSEIKSFKSDISDENSIPDNTINCISKDSKYQLCIGTANGGMCFFNPAEEKFTNLTESDGLPNNFITGILEDKNGDYWIGTNNGLSRYKSNERKLYTYDETDGLPSREFNEGAYFTDSKRIIYFGTMNGLVYFNPDEIRENLIIPEIVLTDFEIFNKTVSGSPENEFLKKNISYASEINLTHRESVFSFGFTSLIFNNPQKNQYAYKMEGFDKDWTYCGTRKRTTYTNLDPGEYIFRVKGSNNDGIWNEEGASVKINISPPYWKTWWFKGLTMLGAAAITGLTYKQRLKKLEKESKMQEEFSRKLIEVQENEKKRIASELHDTIAQSVSISKNKATMALKHRDDKKRLEETLEEITEMAASTISDLRNIAFNLHPHQLDKLGFTKAIESIVNEVSKSTNINFDIVADDSDDVLSKEAEINLFRAIQECINNIMNHSKATEAILKLSKQTDHLLILIIDNGRGFDVNNSTGSDIKHGFGLPGIYERIKLMGGEIKIDSEQRKGTTIRIKIPY